MDLNKQTQNIQKKYIYICTTCQNVNPIVPKRNISKKKLTKKNIPKKKVTKKEYK